jgi:disulfide bond formation protein DsbB
MQRPAALLGAVAFLSLAAVAAALVSQHVFGMEPCPWCVLQRLIFVAIALACGLGVVWRAAAGRIVAALLVLVLSLSGVAAALWLHFVASKSASCNLTLADRIIVALQLDTQMPEVFSPRANCAEAAVDLLGLPYTFWSLGLFALFAALAVMLLSRARLSSAALSRS